MSHHIAERPPGGVTDSQLAVLFRQLQWALDDAAHDFPAGRATPRRRTELAGTLEALAAIVRASVPPSLDVCRPCERPTVLDVPPPEFPTTPTVF